MACLLRRSLYQADALRQRCTEDVMRKIKRRRVTAATMLMLHLTLAQPALAVSPTIRTYVILGQGSYITSFCMASFAKRLRSIDPRMIVTTHNWNKYGDVAREIMRASITQPVVVIGYSLGGNATTWITNALPLKFFELVVAYDPSVLTTTLPAGLNIKRLLLYHNNSLDPWGHARIRGLQVETVETYMSHLAVDCSKKLHDRTIRAVTDVLRNTEEAD
jgi:hypothetical protein